MRWRVVWVGFPDSLVSRPPHQTTTQPCPPYVSLCAKVANVFTGPQAVAHGHGLRWPMLADRPDGRTASGQYGPGHPESYRSTAALPVGQGTARLLAHGWSSVGSLTMAFAWERPDSVAANHGRLAGLCTSRPAGYWGPVLAARAVPGGSGRWRALLSSRYLSVRRGAPTSRCRTALPRGASQLWGPAGNPDVVIERWFPLVPSWGREATARSHSSLSSTTWAVLDGFGPWRPLEPTTCLPGHVGVAHHWPPCQRS